jgi:hypothetical protein
MKYKPELVGADPVVKVQLSDVLSVDEPLFAATRQV